MMSLRVTGTWRARAMSIAISKGIGKLNAVLELSGRRSISGTFFGVNGLAFLTWVEVVLPSKVRIRHQKKVEVALHIFHPPHQWSRARSSVFWIWNFQSRYSSFQPLGGPRPKFPNGLDFQDIFVLAIHVTGQTSWPCWVLRAGHFLLPPFCHWLVLPFKESLSRSH